MTLQAVPTTPAAPSRLPAPRVGIIGTGFMGRVHARAALVAGGQLVGVVGSSPAGSAVAAVALRADRAFDSLDALLESDVDVIHVCTPNNLHTAIAAAAIAAGKHVICEKPLAMSASAAREMAAGAHEAGVTATVPFIYRYHPMVREARARVEAGDVGALSTIHGSYLQDWLSGPSDDNWRVDAAIGGRSRAFGDIGSHWCDLAEYVTGERIVELAARMLNIPRVANADRNGPPTEDAVTMTFRTASGAIGAVVVSQISPGRKNRLFLEVSGSEATVAFDQEQSELLWVGGRAGSQLLLRDPESMDPSAAAYSRVPAGHAMGYQDCFDAFVADTYAAVAGAAPTGLPRFADGLRAATICEAVLTSAGNAGAWTEVPA